MNYAKTLINVSRQQLLSDLKTKVSPKRFEHILGVEETALKLAEKYQIDSQKASIAALLHDYAKEMDRDVMLQLALKFWNHPLFETADTTILHGFAAATIAKEQFGIEDEDVLEAVAYHTAGAKQMNPVAKVLYVADYIEPSRSFPGVDKARSIAFEDLDEAVLYKMKQTLTYLISKEYTIFPDTIEVYNEWIK
ncbi:HD domain-containing protein [Dolosicoccus paucivorans]|uniref:bis(5'-nucleosyl)-tetraphosphatase (symmetrical) n=1 Tax=Dolosicoccus paucivorans TaxID=84521 RepID=A0A2N6SQ84_9LACT|nr:bis(5'-nucleosyl)-tetraphosphatase (symmetrical) YqeK [Dolosicoccus paucivorans]PMB84690.1 HD domain-containing protein [Dolosicoccus paucivorans]PMC59206.1 HD domain-containing protein [Dolosicoccus paucivorans]